MFLYGNLRFGSSFLYRNISDITMREAVSVRTVVQKWLLPMLFQLETNNKQKKYLYPNSLTPHGHIGGFLAIKGAVADVILNKCLPCLNIDPLRLLCGHA